MYNKLFTKIIAEHSTNELHHLLRPKSEAGYTLGSNTRPNMYNIRTNRFKTLVPAMCRSLVRYILPSILFRSN